MNRVRVLPDDLANQIAAGEVVERPSSVVKELVENALDAGARRVRIDAEGGGIGLLRVADDGRGMDREDARLAVLRHATSKIAHADDLRCIRSFGFRGEALPSIASVSRFTLRSRPASQDEGTEVRIEGGGPMQVSPCGCAGGTVVEVRDLFFNMPARRKFLRAVGTEAAHVTEVAQAVALGEPSVTVILSRDGRVVREWLRASSREERARGAFAGEDLAACRGERGPLAVEAFLSRPERARSGAGGLSIFVNGRYVRDRALSRAVAMAYGSVLEMGRYPLGAVYIDLPHELVDVNVHPQKAEVRFADGRAVTDALYKVVAPELAAAFGLPEPSGSAWGGRKQKLMEAPEAPGGNSWTWLAPTAPAADAIPAPPPRYGGAGGRGALEDEEAQSSMPFGDEGARMGMGAGAGMGARAGVDARAGTDGRAGVDARAGAGADAGAGELGASPTPYAAVPSSPGAAPVMVVPTAPPVPYPTAADLAAASQRPGAAFRSLSYVAQVRRMFLLCEGTDGLYIIDQHAAAERVTFHRLRRAYEARDVAVQKLLFPVIVGVAPLEVSLVEEAQAEIERAGFDVRAAGPTQIAVHAVPLLLARASPERLVRDLLGELSHSGERAFSGAVDLAIATMACHGSIRAGDQVAPEEARALLVALDEADFAGHCPHGRPIVMRVGWPELETRVGRR